MILKKLLITVCFLQLCFALIGQNEAVTYKTQILTRHLGDSIMIRWAPLDYKTWEIGKIHGFIVEKKSASKSTYEPLNNGKPILPLSLEDWKPIIEKDSTAVVGAGLLYTPHQVVLDPNNFDPMQLDLAVKEKENKFAFSLLVADSKFHMAEKMGLAYIDYQVIPNEEVLYRIYPAFEIKNAQIDTGYTLASTDLIQPLKPARHLKAEFGNRKVYITWNNTMIKRDYTSYAIECSEDFGQTYYRVNEQPFVPMETRETDVKEVTFGDSLSENGKHYIFRVRGITAFGELGPPTDTIGGMGIDPPLPIAPVLSGLYENVDGHIQLNWIFPDTFINKIKGFQIYRAASRNGPKMAVGNFLPATQNSFLDQNPKVINFYTIVAIDKNNHELTAIPRLIQLSDNEPPIPPVGLEGKISPEGQLNLYWTANTEEDLLGYQVYMGTGPTIEFAQISNKVISTTQFMDSVNTKTLASHLYFKVKAVDYRENYSAFSEVIEIPIPDLIPPVAPVWKKTKASENGVALMWASSSSIDVVKEHLLRRVVGTANIKF